MNGLREKIQSFNFAITVSLAVLIGITGRGRCADDPPKASNPASEKAAFIGEWSIITSLNTNSTKFTVQILGNADPTRMQRKLILNEDMTGTYYSTGNPSEIRDAEIKDGELTFDYTTNTSPPLDFSFSGEIVDGKLVGAFLLRGDVFSEVVGTKVAKKPTAESKPSGTAPLTPVDKRLIGTWDVTVESALGVDSYKLIFKADVAPTFAAKEDAAATVKNLKVEGDTVSFEVPAAAKDNQKNSSKFQGKLAGETLNGKLTFIGGSANFLAKKVKS